MLVVDWDEKKGWSAPEIVPYGDFHISPMSSSLHYGLQLFEGTKAFKDA